MGSRNNLHVQTLNQYEATGFYRLELETLPNNYCYTLLTYVARSWHTAIMFLRWYKFKTVNTFLEHLTSVHFTQTVTNMN